MPPIVPGDAPPEAVPTKPCKGCGLEKPTADFHKSSNPCGFTARCKICHYAQVSAKRLENHEENKAKARQKANAKYQEAPEFFREKARRWRAANPEKARAVSRACEEACRDKRQAYRAANTERRKAYQKAYTATNKERLLAYNREYYQKNAAAVKARIKTANEAKPDFYADIHRRWKKANPDACRAMSNRRRTRLTGNGGSYTAKQWIELKSRFDNRCLMCNRQEPEILLTFDHIVPVSRGGTSDITNGQPLCKSCNSKKHRKILDLRPA